jgi:hypothetical protein
MSGIRKGKSRSEELLESLRMPESFRDSSLPKGVFSYSQYMMFRRCARAYEFKYVLGISEPSRPRMVRGSALHRGIEFALRKKQEGGTVHLEEMKEKIRTEFEKQRGEVQDWGEDKPDLVRQEALSLYEAFHTSALSRIQPVAVEKGFAVRFGGVPMVGFVDVVDRQPMMEVKNLPPEVAELAPHANVVVDFKSSAAKWSEKELRSDVQLTLYAAAERTPRVRVDQLIPYKRGATYVAGESIRTPTDVAVLEEDLGEVAAFVRKGIFPMTSIDSWACTAGQCAFWTLCRGRRR